MCHELLSVRQTLSDEGVMPGSGMSDRDGVSESRDNRVSSDSDQSDGIMADAGVSETSKHYDSGDEHEDESGEDNDSGDEHEDESGEGREQYDIRTEDGCQKLGKRKRRARREEGERLECA